MEEIDLTKTYYFVGRHEAFLVARERSGIAWMLHLADRGSAHGLDPNEAVIIFGYGYTQSPAYAAAQALVSSGRLRGIYL